MAPAEVASIMVDEDAHTMDVAVDEENLISGDWSRWTECKACQRIDTVGAECHVG